MKNKILQCNDALYLACIWLSGGAILIMSIIIPWGIFTRYVLGTGSQWPEPIAILLMVIFTFMGAAVAYRAGSHIAVAMLTDRMPPRLHQVCAYLVHAWMLAIAMFMAIYGGKLCQETWGQNIGEIPWMPVGATYLPVPIGGFVTLLFILEHLAFGSQHNRSVVTFDHAIEETQAL